jgi:hypothetical protein
MLFKTCFDALQHMPFFKKLPKIGKINLFGNNVPFQNGVTTSGSGESIWRLRAGLPSFQGPVLPQGSVSLFFAYVTKTQKN